MTGKQIEWTCLDSFATGDRVAIEYIVRSTHSGAMPSQQCYDNLRVGEDCGELNHPAQVLLAKAPVLGLHLLTHGGDDLSAVLSDTCLRAAVIKAPISRTRIVTSASTWTPGTRGLVIAAASVNCRSDAATFFVLRGVGFLIGRFGMIASQGLQKGPRQPTSTLARLVRHERQRELLEDTFSIGVRPAL